MKKTILILLLSIFVVSCNNSKKAVKYGDNPNYPMAWYLDVKEGSLGGWNTGPNGSPAQGSPALEAGAVYGYVSTGDQNWLSINGYSEAGGDQGYLFNETIEIDGGKPVPQAASKCQNCLTFEYVKDTIIAPATTPVHYYNVSFVNKTAPYTEGLIDWTSGQTGKVPGSVWTSDYNFEDSGRWTSDGTSTVQGTQETGGPQYGYNYGSRAYPVNVLDAQYNTDDNAYGVAMNGVWQIDIKIGSNGGSSSPDNLFCETFYLAERVNQYWDNKYYLDDSPQGGSRANSQYGREIDIMETKWKPEGPQANLPNGNPSDPASHMSWNTDLSGTDGYNKQESTWDKVYTAGFPNATTYATFGVAILDEGLYFYAYDDQGNWLYADGPHPEKNDSYKQTGPFVPYIGTWTDQDLGTKGAYKQGIPGGFSTSYKNFVYKTVAEMNGKNPLDNKDAYGPALVK